MDMSTAPSAIDYESV